MMLYQTCPNCGLTKSIFWWSLQYKIRHGLACPKCTYGIDTKFDKYRIVLSLINTIIFIAFILTSYVLKNTHPISNASFLIYMLALIIINFILFILSFALTNFTKEAIHSSELNENIIAGKWLMAIFVFIIIFIIYIKNLDYWNPLLISLWHRLIHAELR